MIVTILLFDGTILLEMLMSVALLNNLQPPMTNRRVCLMCCRRVDMRRCTDAESSAECHMRCTWHVGLHYLLPFSQMTTEERRRHVLSQDVAGNTACYLFIYLFIYYINREQSHGTEIQIMRA